MSCYTEGSCPQNGNLNGVPSNCEITPFCTKDAVPCSDVAVFQDVKNSAPTQSALTYPNQPTSWFEAGEAVYKEARGKISQECFLQERDEAFAWFIERFAIPSDYRLVPVDLTTIADPENSIEILLGTPLWRIETGPTSEPIVVGYYRPVVNGRKIKVQCAPQLGRCPFRQALFVSHQIFFTPEFVLTLQKKGLLKSSHHSHKPKLPPKQSPQQMNGTPNVTFQGLAVAEFGFLQLYETPFPLCNKPCKFAEIKFRYLYALQTWFSTSDPAGQIVESGTTGGVKAEAASCDFNNGTWNGIMTLTNTIRLFNGVPSGSTAPQFSLEQILGAQVHFPPALLRSANIWLCDRSRNCH
jgi:hypothetical protein